MVNQISGRNKRRRNCDKEKRHNLHRKCNIVMVMVVVIMMMIMGVWMGNEHKKIMQSIDGNNQGKRKIGKSRQRWDENIKTDLNEM
jgi:hypothetical protein